MRKLTARNFIPFLLTLILSACSDHRLVKTHPLPDNFTLEILADNSWEYNQAVSYRITRNGAEHIPLTFFGVIGDADSLDVIDSGRGVVGLAPSTRRHDIVILFDTNSQATWPRSLPDEQPDQTHSRGEQLLATLKTATGNPSLKLSDR